MGLLGMGTIAFAAGKDGGRDGKFTGTAQSFPSTASPLAGRFIIQAKHTSNPVASCSDAEFGRIMNDESPNVRSLVAEAELDHYIVFTNRKKPANSTIALENTLLGLGPKTVHILGVEQLREWLTAHPEIWSSLGFDRFDVKLEFNAPDMVEVVRAFHDSLRDGVEGDASASDFSYVTKAKKNKINRLTPAYDAEIRRDSLKFFKSVEDFLKNPRNEELRNLYHDTADEIRMKLAINAERFERFDDALTYTYDLVVQSSANLRGRRRYVRVFLHYMYWTCDIGQHDHTDEAS